MLTDLAIEKMPLPEGRREVPDGKVTGLYLIVQPSGRKSWALRYRLAGAARKFTIGPYPAIGLKAARARAMKALADIADGRDPSAEKQAERTAAKAEAVAEDRLEAVVAAFVKKHIKVKVGASWARESERILRVEVLPKWGNRRLGEVTPRDVGRLLEDIAERAPITANRTLAVLRKMCNWAATPKIGLIAASPCNGIEAPAPEHGRDRVLTDDELRRLWMATEAVGWPFGPLVRMLLYTAARREEVGGLRWAELDLDAATWTLPGARTKNGKEHVIPLPSAAVELLRGLPILDGSPFVFSTTGRTSVSGFNHSKIAIDRAMCADGSAIEHWVMHDLRRTVATNLQRLGVRLEVTEAVLNHVSGSRAGIVGIYQRYEWTDEKRAALDAWARRLDEIVTGRAGNNVVPIRRAGEQS